MEDAHNRLAKLKVKSRHDAPIGKRMQDRAQDFKRLVELRDDMVTLLL